MTVLRQAPAALLILVAVAACGGGAAVASAPGGAGASPTPSDPTSVAPPATSGAPAPVATSAASAPTTGGGGGVCDLVTTAELESIFAVTGVTTSVVAGPPDTCDIQQDSAPLAAIVLTPSGGRMIFDILAAGSDAERVDGLGDGAFYSSSTLLLVIARGDAMASIAVFDDGRPEAERLDLMKQIGAIAAGRM